MKDIHCHILMGIDDGSISLENSLEILRKANEEGVTDIMLTPHYINNSKYSADNQTKIQLMNILQEAMTKENININLYIGNETYIDENIIQLINERKVATLNNSRYILIELPVANQRHDLKEIFFELIRNNYIPIIAHPERYLYFQKDISKLDEYIEMGVLLQGDYQSLFGHYGKKAEKTLKKLLKDHMIQFLGSDTHRSKDGYNVNLLMKKLLKILKNEEMVELLLHTNFDKVIKNEEISSVTMY